MQRVWNRGTTASLKAASLKAALFTAALAVAAHAAVAAPPPLGPVVVASPDAHLVVSVAGTGQAGAATWRLRVDRQDGASKIEVLAWSPVGLTRDDGDFTHLRLTSTTEAHPLHDSYTLLHGKRLVVASSSVERVLHFQGAGGRPMDLVVRVFDNGMAFRYRFPDASTESHSVTAEATGFTVPVGSRAWLLPHQPAGKYTPAYEEIFLAVNSGSSSPNAAGWSYPALFRLPEGEQWVLLTEAGLDPSYCGTHLAAEAPGGTYHVQFPDPAEARGLGAAPPSSTLPWATPWRAVITGTLNDVFASTMVTDLSAPSAVTDTTWIHPGRVSWSWWRDDDSPEHEDALLKYVDLAASMHWEYSLIDAGWNRLPEGALERVIAHAKDRNVGILLWYNSGGPHNEVLEYEPRDKVFDPATRRAEFARIAALGVKGVKVDFWQSDKQSTIQLYYDMMKDAASAHLLIDVHGSTIPRGWSRTWPNLVSLEAVHGAEQYKFDPRMSEHGAEQNTILAFTRNVIGPMDYTPVTLSDKKFPHQTSNAHELALSVVFESGLQHFADGPEAYAAIPDAAQQFLRDVPVTWDESRLLTGEPGSLVVVARRHGHDWWVGAISGTTTGQTVPLDLSFLGNTADWNAVILRDGAVPHQVVSEAALVRAVDHMNIPLLARGGFALHVSPK